MRQSLKCHFIGIGGIGMSGLARILLSRQQEVSGSDIATNYVIEGLVKAGAKIYQGQQQENISSDMTIIYSSDIKETNPEYQAALKLKCPLLHRSDLLKLLMSDYKALAVAGTHGKTTTSSLLTWVFHCAKANPGFAVGGMIPQFQTNAAHGTGEYFIAEADESDGTFLKYSPYGAIVTNIDNDHMNYYITEERLIDSFKQFINQVQSSPHLFWCGDDHFLPALNPRGIAYGFGSHCQLKGSNFVQEGWRIFFDVAFEGKHYSQVEVSLTGQHNALNAMAVFGLALKCGLAEADIRRALKTFEGVGRRCDKKGESGGVLVLDDYAHHPTEVVATLKAIRGAIQERRLIVVFQAHRYSRTKDLLGGFGGIFDAADEVWVTEVFAAGEQPIAHVSHESILQELAANSRAKFLFASRQDIVQKLADNVRPHDVVVTLGAGDITKVGPELLAHLEKNGVHKYRVGVAFGGKSDEHAISLLSARHVCKSLNPHYYDVQQFALTRDGSWMTGQHLLSDKASLTEEVVSQSGEVIPAEVWQELAKCDILFPVFHGPHGEDGTIQGFFETLGKAYVGCDFRSAAICMDKGITKTLVQKAGIDTSPFLAFSRNHWFNAATALTEKIKADLTLPVFVKPSHLGSTIGVQKVAQWDELNKAIDLAFKLDTEVVIENGLDIREIEFAVYGNANTHAFPPGEVLTDGQTYGFQEKYGDNALKVAPRAELIEELIQEGMQLAKKAYQAAKCCGMARVDFFLDRQGKFWFNEINPIPGFTRFSLYPLICEQHGLPGSALMDKLIVLGLEKQRHKK